MPRFTIHDLAETIDARAAAGGEASYTRKLLDKGADVVEVAVRRDDVIHVLEADVEPREAETGRILDDE